MGIFRSVRHLGFWLALKHYFAVPLWAANGMEWYLAVKDKKVPSKRPNSLLQIFLFLLANFLLVLLGTFLQGFRVRARTPEDLPSYIGAYLLLLLSTVVLGGLGTLFSKREWHFRLNSGGAIQALLLILMWGFYPMIGGWYPKQYEKTQVFRRELGVTSLLKWLFLMGLSLGLFLANTEENYFALYLSLFTNLLLLYTMLPFYPFEGYGGGRVYRWNKVLYIAMTLVSAILLVLFLI